jgi:hypothetical protein
MKLWDSMVTKALSGEIERRVRTALSAAEEDPFFAGVRSMINERDRYDSDREELLRQALEAWRVNPLARRIVGLTTQYVVGSGLSITCKHSPTHDFIREFVAHPLNRFPVRISELCDELTRSGNLFVLLSTDASGMSFIRCVPALDIDRIEHRPNDVEQPVAFYPKADLDNPDPAPWPAYEKDWDIQQENGSFLPVMIHYAINRPVGAQWGESDLAPVLRWLARYASWLEDRARLNRFRNAFMYVVKAKFASEAERISRQRALNMNPPGPGAILVTDENETWEVIAPKLEASDANTDGLALKKMIASGSGVPLHFLAEPESSTRTTAESAGGSTYRHYEQRQQYVTWMVGDLLRIALERRARVDKRVKPTATITVTGADISARDNVALGLAGIHSATIARGLRDRGLIDDSEFVRLVYKFAGETGDVEELLAHGKAALPPKLYGEIAPSISKGSRLPKNDLNEDGEMKPGSEGAL